MATTTNTPKSDISASRKELDIILEEKNGKALPQDLYGYALFNSSVGTVNSGGLPYSVNPHDLDGSSPIFNGDSMILRFDFQEAGKVKLKTRLLRTPCFYLDEATRYADPKKDPAQAELHKSFGFHNAGISRFSTKLGFRNSLSTAVVPFRFPGDKGNRMLATYDAGRLYEFDAETLAIKTPIGTNEEWNVMEIDLDPKANVILTWPLPIVQGTAHPVFDPVQKELFAVNYSKSLKTMMEAMKLIQQLTDADASLISKVKIIIAKLLKLLTSNRHKRKQVAKGFGKLLKDKIFNRFTSRSLDSADEDHEKWLQEVENMDMEEELNKLDAATDSGMTERGLESKAAEPQDNVFLMKWNGSGPWQTWQLIDEETGDPIEIMQCMHQMNLSRDYIILIDASFKITIDIMFTSPLANDPHLDNFLREITTGVMEPETSTYIVRRADLQPGAKEVKVKKLKPSIPVETLHFSNDYENPDDQITLYGAHNSAACLAEWVRWYDKQALGNKELDPAIIGFPSMGQLDINRIGKFVIDAKQGSIINKTILEENGKKTEVYGEFLCLKGDWNKHPNIGPNTWGIGIYTFRDIISPTTIVPRIKNMYWQNYGLDQRLLTSFIFDLYTSGYPVKGGYPNRVASIEEIKKYTQMGLPYSLFRLNVEGKDMQIADYYQFPQAHILHSLQFIPRSRKPGEVSGIDPSMDGYIMCTVRNNQQEMEKSCEIWLFDAAKLAQGPAYVLVHPELRFGATLHSVWQEEAGSTPTTYYVDVKEDYAFYIKHSINRTAIEKLFEQYVYPHFPPPGK